MAFFGIGVLLTFFTGDERFLLVKGSPHTSVAGCSSSAPASPGGR
jgi:hypothetical protein